MSRQVLVLSIKVPTNFDQVEFASFATAQPAFHVTSWRVTKQSILRIYASQYHDAHQLNKFLMWLVQ
jgi:hypothetical protein